MMGGVGWAPLLRVSGLAALMVGMGIVDGVREPMNLFLGVLLAETALLSVAVWLLAKLLLFFVRRLCGERFQAAAIGVLALVLFVASLFPIYTTPASSTSDRSNVFELLD